MSLPVISQSDRGFGLMFAGVFAVLYGAVWLAFGVRWDWAAVLAVLFLIAALAFPGILLPFNRLWSAFAGRLGHFNNHLLLGIFYYLIMTPAGFIMRLSGSDPMHRRPDRNQPTYWQPVRRNPDRENLSDMF